MTRCGYNGIWKCIVGAYEQCLSCEKYPQIYKRHEQGKVHRRVIKECIMCALIKATPDSNITEHHLVPNGLARKHLAHKINETVYMCYNHHKLFEALIEPIVDILNAKSTYQTRKEITDYFLYMKLPELQKRIKKIVNEVYQE